MSKKIFYVLLSFIAIYNTQAQDFQLSGELRYSPVYSRGFRIPLYENTRPEGYILQRSRLIVNYSDSTLKTEIILQDRRAWGEVGGVDSPDMGIFRAWFEKSTCDHFSFKMGRLGLIYDDQYLFGGRNWGGTQAHDALVLKYDKKFTIHGILAYSTQGFNLQRTLYQGTNYKTLQAIYLKKKTKKLQTSWWIINKGMEAADTTINYLMTFATNTKFDLTNKLNLQAILIYAQTQEFRYPDQ